MADGQRIGGLFFEVTADRTSLDRTLAQIRAEAGKTQLKVQIVADGTGSRTLQDALRDTKALTAETKAQSQAAQNASREKAAAARAEKAETERLTAAIKQQAAEVQKQRQEAALSTAKVREQNAQLALTARLRSEEAKATQQSIDALNNEQRAYRNLWQARQMSDDQVIEAQRRIYAQALQQAQAVDKTSDAYRRLTQVMAGAQRTIDSAQGINTPGGFAAGVSQGILQALGNLGPFGQLLEQIISSGMQGAAEKAREEARDVAKNAGDGLATGLVTEAPKIRKASMNLAKEVQDGAEDQLDIHSPSRVMRRVGAFAGDGLSEGLLSKRAEVAAAAKQLARTAEMNGTPNLGAVSGGGVGGVAVLPALNNAEQGMARFAGSAALTTAAVGATALAVGGLAAGFVALGNAGLEQTKIMEKAVNTLRANGEKDIEGFKLKVGELKESLGSVGGLFTKADLTAASAEIVKAGATTADALNLMGTAAKLAAAENLNLNDASGMLLKNLRSYQMEATESAKLGNQLAAAGGLAAGSASDLSTGFNKVGSTAFQAKLKSSELLAMLTELDNSGLSAADTGAEGLRSALASLADITDEGKEALTGWGIATEDASGKARPAGDILKDLAAKVGSLGISYNKQTGELEGNGEALRQVSSIMDTGAAAAVLNLKGKWQDYNSTIENSAGKLDDYTETMTQGVEPAQKRLSNAFKDAGEALTKSFAGPLADFLNDTLTPVVNKLGEFFDLMSKDPPAVRATLQVDWAKDSGTTAAYKLIVGGIQGVKETSEAAGNNIWLQLYKKIVSGEVAFGTLQYAMKENSARGLRNDLVGAGLMPRAKDDVDRSRQIQEVFANFDKYLAQWQAYLKKSGAALQTQAAQPMQPLAGQGPLLPGQNRTTDVSGLAIVAGVGMGGRTRGTPYNQTYGPNGSWGKHVGEDFFAPVGTGVYAPFTGYASLRQDKAQGNIVDLFDAAGKRLSMIHLDQYAEGLAQAVAKAGGRLLVQQGQLLATVGQTGTAAHAELGAKNSHLHMHATNAAGQIVDPFGQTYQGVTSGTPWAGSPKAPAPTPKPGGGEVVTSEQVAKAQALLAALEKAKDARDPKAIAAATAALEKWSKASDSNKAALDAVKASQEGLNKSTKDYVVTQADVQKYGTYALQLIKAREAAEKSGDAARIASANRAIELWQGESAAKRAVLQVEQTAYQARQSAAKKAEQDADEQARKDEARRKEAQQQAAKVNEAIRQRRIESARTELTRLQEMRTNDLRNAGDNAQRVAQVEQRYATLTYNAKAAIALKEKQDRDADIRNNPDLNGTARAQALKNSNQTYLNALKAAGNERRAALDGVNKDLEAAAAKNAATMPGLMSGWIDDWAKDQEKDRAAATAGAAVVDKLFAGAIDQLGKSRAEMEAALTDALTEIYQKAIDAGIDPFAGGSPDQFRDMNTPGRSGLAALIGGNPAGFLAAYTATGGTPDALLKEFADADWETLGLDVLQGLADGMRSDTAWDGVRGVVEGALGRILADSAFAADVAALVSDRNGMLGAPAGIVTGNERPDGERTSLAETVGKKAALDAYAESLKVMDADQLAVAESAAIAADNTDFYNAITAERARRLQEQKDKAEAAAKAERELAEAVAKKQADAIAQAAKDTEDYNAAQDALAKSSRELGAAMGEVQAPYQSQIEALEDLKVKMPSLGAEIDALIARWKELQAATIKSNQLEQLAQGFQKLSNAISGVFKSFGADGVGQIVDGIGQIGDAALKLPGAFKDAQSAWGAFKSGFSLSSLGGLMGAVGGVVNIVGAAINGIMAIGNAIEDMSASLREWKKGLREIAEEQKKALGMSTGGFKSPWADALAKDASNRDQLANSKWYQRLWWGLTGGGPQAISDEAAKLLTELQGIFAQLGDGIASAFTDAMLDAFNSGDMGNFAENFSKAFDQVVGKVVLKTMIDAAITQGAVAGDLAELTKAIQEQRYGDIPAIMTKIKADAGVVAGQLGAVLPSIPGFGAGADGSGGSGGTDNRALFGNAPTAQLGIPRFEVSLPDGVMKPLGDFAAVIPAFSRATDRLYEAADMIVRSGWGLQKTTGLGPL